MPLSRRSLLAASLATPILARAARAQAAPIKIGVLTDLSGTYRDFAGQTSAAAVRQAIADLGDHNLNVEVIVGDHQNKPDVGAGLARQWFDRDGVDLIIDCPTSSVALAVNEVAKEKNRIFIDCGAATPDLTGAQCTATTIHWSYDTYMLARSTGGALVKAGGDSWFFITADYVFGQQLQRDTTRFVTESNGTVTGSVKYPFPGTTDFSSYILQAQSSGAKVLGLANAGADTVNTIKQAHEFGLTSSMKIAALLMVITDVHGLGLEAAQGLVLTESFYWDLNDRTRAFTNRLMSQQKPPNHPDMVHAGCYAGTLHYLKSVAALGADKAKADPAATVAHMKATPTEDDAFGAGSIRQDGRALFPAYLFQVKTAAESKAPWDYYKLVQTTPAALAAMPLEEGKCPLVKT